MKPNHAKPATGGFTGWDLLICVVTVLLLLLVGFLLFPNSGRGKIKASRINCVSNLKQIGLGFRMWSNDHYEKFPWEVSSDDTNSGTKEFALTGEVWRHFQAISNELSTPRVLACSDDTRRKISDWQSFTNNSHLSYFVGLDASEIKPQSMLSGDRNLTSNVKPVKGVLTLSAGDSLEWTTAIHNKNGNVGLADGSVAQLTKENLSKQFQTAIKSTHQPIHRLALPE